MFLATPGARPLAPDKNTGDKISAQFSQALSRRYNPRRAFPFQRGEPCARVFLFQPPLLLQSSPHPVVRYFGVLARIQASLVSHWPLAASQLDNTRASQQTQQLHTREATEASTGPHPSIARDACCILALLDR